MKPFSSIFFTLLSISIGFLFTLAISANSVLFADIPIMYIVTLYIFMLQWIIFIPSYVYQTEHYYDLTGSMTYITAILLVTLFSQEINLRDVLICSLILIWASRLGLFLSRRVKNAGEDKRFKHIKPNFYQFLMAWTIQGLWVLITAGMAFAALSSQKEIGIDAFAVTGGIIWLLGFVIEVLSDQQKSKFKNNPENADKFIQSGLWSWSRHPNYFGEIVLWIGIAIIAFPVIEGWQYVALISPIFVIFLLTMVSGVNLLERQGMQKWGHEEDYLNYLKRTSSLIPLPPKS